MSLGFFGNRQVLMTSKRHSAKKKRIARKKHKRMEIAGALGSILKSFTHKPAKRKKNKKQNQKAGKKLKKKIFKKIKPKKKPGKKLKKKSVKKSKKKLTKPLKKKIKPAKQAKSREKEIGEVTHFFSNANAAVIKLKARLSIGDAVRIKGATTDFAILVSSMQINRKPIKKGKKGDDIGLLVSEKVRAGDKVYRE